MKTFSQFLREAVVTTTTASGMTSATIRSRGSSSNRAVNKLINQLNSIKNVIFIQQVEDNGAVCQLTIGKPNKPTIVLMIQRRDNGMSFGPRSFGYSAYRFTDANGEKLDNAFAVVSVNDKNTMYGYSSTNNRLRTLVRQAARLQQLL